MTTANAITNHLGHIALNAGLSAGEAMGFDGKLFDLSSQKRRRLTFTTEKTVKGVKLKVVKSVDNIKYFQGINPLAYKLMVLAESVCCNYEIFESFTTNSKGVDVKVKKCASFGSGQNRLVVMVFGSLYNVSYNDRIYSNEIAAISAFERSIKA